MIVVMSLLLHFSLEEGKSVRKSEVATFAKVEEEQMKGLSYEVCDFHFNKRPGRVEL